LKKAISIFFLATYLFATTQLGELLKLPVLVNHYVGHKQENKNLSFLGFLKMHYFNGDPKDADYDEDMKLPFKSVTFSSFTSVVFCTPMPSFKQNIIIYFKNDTQHFSEYAFQYTSAFLSTIWQPPRV
jgi:hypothetical protein